MNGNNDLISRQAVIKAIRNHINVNRERADRGYAAMIREEDIEIIEQLPSAEKVGKWMLEREPDGKPYCFHCSNCDDDYHYIGIMTAYDFCPNCGARMINGGNFEG